MRHAAVATNHFTAFCPALFPHRYCCNINSARGYRHHLAAWRAVTRSDIVSGVMTCIPDASFINSAGVSRSSIIKRGSNVFEVAAYRRLSA